MINFALIGTGSIAEKHAQALKSLPNTKLLAIRSNDRARAEAFAKRYEIPHVYTDYTELLANPEINAVDIVTANNTHADLGIQAAKAGKHVLVEKPIDISVKKAEQLIHACKQHNVKLSVISQYRFDEAVLELKKLLDKGLFGKIFLSNASVKWSRKKEYYDASGGWRKNLATAGGGVLIVQAIHHFDLLLYLLGDVESVYAKAGHAYKMEVEDTLVGLLKFKNGALATFEASTTLPNQLNDRLEIHGEKGSAILTKNKTVHFFTLLQTKLSLLDSLKTRSHFKKGHIKQQIQDFTLAIQENRPPRVTGEDGLKTLKTILALYESETLKNEVRLL